MRQRGEMRDPWPPIIGDFGRPRRPAIDARNEAGLHRSATDLHHTTPWVLPRLLV